MGGTFDPVHHGHLVAASEVADRFELDEVVFVPTGEPWQKQGRYVSAAEDRYLMTVIATASNPQFSVSRVDIDRGGRKYTKDTLRDLRGSDPALAGRRGAVLAGPVRRLQSARLRPGRWSRVRRGQVAARRCVDVVGVARAGDLVFRLPNQGRREPADQVPGARGCGAVRHQARTLSRPR